MTSHGPPRWVRPNTLGGKLIRFMTSSCDVITSCIIESSLACFPHLRVDKIRGGGRAAVLVASAPRLLRSLSSEITAKLIHFIAVNGKV